MRKKKTRKNSSQVTRKVTEPEPIDDSPVHDNLKHTKLERRRLLNADFSFDGSSLQLNNFTDSTVNEVVISETGTDYLFTLTEGTWDPGGAPNLGIVADGMGTLSVDRTLAGLVEIIFASDGSAQFDIEFADFDFVGDITIEQSGAGVNFGSITQQEGTAFAQVGTLDITAANVVNLNEAGNNFDIVQIVATDNITLTDVNDIDLQSVESSTGSVDVTAADDVRVGSVTAGTNIDVTAGGSINDLQDDLLVDLTAGERITLSASVEVGGGVTAGSDIDADEKLELATGSEVVAISETGNVELRLSLIHI